MTLDFDLANVTHTEFGVGRDDGHGQTFAVLPIDAGVRDALLEMVRATRDAMRKDEEGPAAYDPSETHRSREYLTLRLTDPMASAVRDLHEATELAIAGDALDEPADIFCYFARMIDTRRRRLTAVRRASQLKGVLKKRLVHFRDDALRLIEDSVFKLDRDFDFLVDSSTVHIWRPSGFEFAGRLPRAILDAVPANIEALRRELPYVELAGIEAHAAKHPRAARHLASIRAQGGARHIDRPLLERLCRQSGVELQEARGRITVRAGHELGFLEVLDRRRYAVNLVRERLARYRTAEQRAIRD